jgi:ligand-binding sensor domain-containing protein/two-component sensor histidine kinase
MDEMEGQFQFQRVDIGMPSQLGDDTDVEALESVRNGSLWIGTSNGLYFRRTDGRCERYTMAQGLPSNFVNALLEDHTGRVWAGMRFGGLCKIVPEPDLNHPVVKRLYTPKDGLSTDWIASLFETSDHRLWVGTNGGVSEMVDATKDGPAFHSYTTEQGLSDREVWAMAEDRDGSLWLGTINGGAMKLARNGFIEYGTKDGLDVASAQSIFADREGRVCVFSRGVGRWAINRFDGRRFIAVQPSQPTDSGVSWGWDQVVFQDHKGEWWVHGSGALYRYAKTARLEELAYTKPKAIYLTPDRMGSGAVFRLYEDSRGDIWIGLIAGSIPLVRWERATETFHPYSAADGVPGVPTCLREDTAGHLWIGFYSGGLARDVGGHVSTFTKADGLPDGMIRELCFDGRGRLWIASSKGGLSRVDDPDAEHPRFVNYAMAEGLSSDDVWCITEDQWGRVYAGTGRGLDRLDPSTGQVRHYTAADGLARGSVENAFRDRQGALWFGTSQGLSRLVASPDTPRTPPPIVISGLHIAGVTRRVSALGETAISGLELGPAENDVNLDFFALGFGTGEVLRYQYKLEGADQDWSAPTDQRSVNYANLSPGKYRFVVRALNADGLLSSTPAIVAFKILPPIWQRWWFLSIASIAGSLAIYGGHRYRVGRLIELERVRTRIATDLHDDIGSSLSRMAILSEVVKQQLGGKSKQSAPMLTEIADSARGLVDSMSDIVWAIDPRRDNLSNVVTRVRQFASDVLEAKKIKWDFQVPPEIDDLKLDAEQRRHVFLIFKEALNNIARHADCRSVLLKINLTHHQLVAEVQDDGSGFVVQQNAQEASTNGRGGHGLKNMERRASQLGGRFSIDSSPGLGTHLKLTVPLRKSLA